MTVAYSPTTWNTNDVITKDKLNKIEQGVKTGTLLSGTDIDTDKDWNGKSITNVKTLAAEAVQTSTYAWIPDPGYTQLRYADNPRSEVTGAGVWGTAKTTPPARAGVTGVATVRFTFTGQIDLGATARVLRNGAVVADGYGVSPNSSATVSMVVPVSPGDVLAIQVCPAGWSAGVSAFGIYAYAIPALNEEGVW